VQRLVEEENMLAPSLQQFSLRAEMLPFYIPIRVAEKILFVGESVQMFENDNHSPSRAGGVSFLFFKIYISLIKYIFIFYKYIYIYIYIFLQILYIYIYIFMHRLNIDIKLYIYIYCI